MKKLIICLIILLVGCKEKNVSDTLKANIIQNEKNYDDTVVKKHQSIKEIEYFEINDDNLKELEKSNLKITTEDYHSENSYKYLIKKENFSILMLYAYYDFGNYDSYLVTIDSLNNEISKKLVFFNSAPDGNVENYEYSNFRLSKKLDLEIFNIKIKEDLVTV